MSDVNSSISEVVDILHKLRTIDVAILDHTINLSLLAKAVLPPEIAKSVDVMVEDIKLVKIFAEQAKLYDRTSELESNMDALCSQMLELLGKGGET